MAIIIHLIGETELKIQAELHEVIIVIAINLIGAINENHSLDIFCVRFSLSDQLFVNNFVFLIENQSEL